MKKNNFVAHRKCTTRLLPVTITTRDITVQSVDDVASKLQSHAKVQGRPVSVSVRPTTLRQLSRTDPPALPSPSSPHSAVPPAKLLKRRRRRMSSSSPRDIAAGAASLAASTSPGDREVNKLTTVGLGVAHLTGLLPLCTAPSFIYADELTIHTASETKLAFLSYSYRAQVEQREHKRQNWNKSTDGMVFMAARRGAATYPLPDA